MHNPGAHYLTRLSNPSRALFATEGSAYPEQEAQAFLDTVYKHDCDEAFLKRFSTACWVDGAEPQDYAPRELCLSSGRVLAVIQFFALDTKRAFVDVIAHDSPLIDWSEVRRVIGDEFRLFAPGTIRCWLQPGEAVPAADPAQHGQHVVAASLRRLPAYSATGRVALEPGSATDYDAYVSMCNRILEVRPNSWDYLKPERLENIESCIRDKAWYRVNMAGQTVGYIGSNRARFRSLNGWVMTEKVLEPRLHGKGLGREFEALFLERLAQSDLQVVVGTIDVRNPQSLRASLCVGRKVVESSHFINLSPEP